MAAERAAHDGFTCPLSFGEQPGRKIPADAYRSLLADRYPGGTGSNVDSDCGVPVGRRSVLWITSAQR